MRQFRVTCGAIVLAGLAAAGCSAPSLPAGATGLSGTVVRGPLTPVCQVDVPCEGGFGAAFSVQRGGRQMAQFTTDSSGGFSVALAPGTYQVVPGADAPILDPAAQSRTVTVGGDGWTTVTWHFDTGIR